MFLGSMQNHMKKYRMHKCTMGGIIPKQLFNAQYHPKTTIWCTIPSQNLIQFTMVSFAIHYYYIFSYLPQIHKSIKLSSKNYPKQKDIWAPHPLFLKDLWDPLICIFNHITPYLLSLKVTMNINVLGTRRNMYVLWQKYIDKNKI